MKNKLCQWELDWIDANAHRYTKDQNVDEIKIRIILRYLINQLDKALK